jgi:hypothetical protein
VLDRLQVAVRLRGAFESLDLGFRLLRRHAKPIYLSLLLLLTPLALGLGWLFRGAPWVMPLLIWWLKPVWDRPILHILSRGTFGEDQGVWTTVKALPSVFRHGAIAGLFWRRLSDARSLVLPLFQLEGQGGASYRKRRAVLLRRGRFRATLLTYSCFMFQIVLFVGVCTLIAFLVPKGSGFDLGNTMFEDDPTLRKRWVDLLLQGLPVVAMVVVEPFYIAGGFGLYLNRRVELEGWDIELAFRRLGNRLARLAMGALLLFGLMLPLRAQEGSEDPKAPARAAIKEVMEQPEFQTKKKEEGWHWKAAPKQERKRVQAPTWLEAFMELLRNVAFLMKWVLITGVVAAVAWLLWKYRDAFLGSGGGRIRDDRPTAMFGLDVRPETLPSDVAGTALALWRKGEARAALALLYRASLAELVHSFQMEMPRGATEGECLRTATQLLAPDSGAYFRKLTHAWQGEAYAGRRPADGEALCLGWSDHFRRPR